MKCNKCGFNGNPNLEESGPHTKATCQRCGAYIKMLNKNETRGLVENDRSALQTNMVTVCAWCGRIENNKGVYAPFSLQALEKLFINQDTISHGMCPDCRINLKKEMIYETNM